MNNAMRFGLSAAAISVLAVGIAFVAGGGSFGEAIDATPSPAAGSVDPTPRPTPTPLAEPTTLPASGSLVRGTYIIGDPFPIQVSVPLTDDWGIWGEQHPRGRPLPGLVRPAERARHHRDDRAQPRRGCMRGR